MCEIVKAKVGVYKEVVVQDGISVNTKYRLSNSHPNYQCIKNREYRNNLTLHIIKTPLYIMLREN